MAGAPEIPNEALPYSEFVEGKQLQGVDWDDFRVFLAVVEAGSLHRAAGTLGLTQPTASKRLSRLERALCVRLFDRDRTGSRLTRDGLRVYSDVSSARLSLARAARHAQIAKRRIEGDCKLVMGDGLANFWLPHFLRTFFETNPNIELKLFVSHDTMAGKNELFDLQIHYFQPAETDYVTLRLGSLHFIPFASRAYVQKYGTPKSNDELDAHRLLGHAAYLIDKGAWAGWFRQSPTQTMSMLTNQSGPLAWSVKLGVGIGLLPTYVTLTDEDFVPLDLGQQFRTPIYLTFQRASAKKWPVRTTIDFLRDIVFDRKTMPWFSDQYTAPEAQWRTLFKERAQMPLQFEAKAQAETRS